MEHSYKITYYFKDKDHISDTAGSLEEARKKAADMITQDPDCCANIVIADFEKETPNKSWVSMERYEKRGDTVTKIEY